MSKLLGIKELCEFWQTIKGLLANKVDKVSGKGLSSNDFTDALKNKLDGIASGAEVNVQSDWSQSDNTKDDYIKNKPSIPAAATANPKMDNAVDVGTSTKYAREDHVHPKDTAKVNKTGDSVSGNISFVSPSIDASKADNNVTQVLYPSTMSISDKDDRLLTRIEANVKPDGDIDGFWFVRNYNTSGTKIADISIRMRTHKDGTVSYNLSHPSKFRTAISAVLEDKGAVTISNWHANTVSGSTNTTEGTKRHGVAIVRVCHQLGANTYANTDTLFKVSPAPVTMARALVAVGSTITTILIDTSGNCRFNNSRTISANTYIIGEVVYAY